MEHYITTCLGRNIRLFRQKRRLSQRALAELAGISPGYVALLEKGEKYPSAKTVERLAEILQTPVARLFADDREVFSHVTKEQWTVFQGILEQITVLTEELHEMLELFQRRTPE